MKHMLQYALRSLARTPGFTLTTILTLAVAIGASTAIFSVVNGVLLKPLPFPESDRLIALTHGTEAAPSFHFPASPAIYFTYRDHNHAFESVALWAQGTATVTGSGNPEQLRTLDSTHELLATLGVQPLLGRAFSADDDRPGAAGTAILSYGYWQRRYGGARSALGQTLIVDGAPRTVIGVLPKDFRFLQQSADLLRPMQPDRSQAYVGPLGENGVARLKPGITVADAAADVNRMLPMVRDEFQAMPGMVPGNRWLVANLEPLKQSFVGDLGDVLRVLMGTVGLLLAIAGANIANLMLARAHARTQDLAIRSALGATTAAIARLLLLESVLLGLAGGAGGLLFAAAALPVLLSLAAPNLPTVLPISIDSGVLLFTAALALIAGVLLGLIPVLRHAGPRIATLLAGAGRSASAGRERQRSTHVLVVAQVAIALILLVGSGLMIRTYQSLRAVEPGFTDPERLLTVDISIPQTVEPSFDRVVRMQQEIVERLGALPGVEASAYVSRPPLAGFGPSSGLFLEGEQLDEGQLPSTRPMRFASPGLFATLGTPLRAGRDFEWRDVYDGRRVALVSENLARAVWGEPQAALGKGLRFLPTDPWSEIVGVVGDVHQTSLDRRAEETVYLPQSHLMAQWMSRYVSLVVRSDRMGTSGFLEEVQRTVWSVNAELPLASVRTLGDAHRQSLARTSLTLVLLAITASMALALGLLGIYGVISHALAQRTREIGVRMALGARHVQLKRLLLGRVLVLVAVGVAVGLGGAAAVTRLMSSMLFGVTALDAPTFAAMAAALVTVAIVAGYLPARRVTRIEPMRALREE
ncbi:MAG TPA: ABC transporter permease [Gammaproteobacteria bacterium]|nr:ABC transporter permease [Gammaproteobacteria bacterium]